MKLKTFIESYGQSRLARELGVQDSTVHNWRYAVKPPRIDQMVRLHKMSRGKVSYQEMIETVAKARGLL